LRYLSVPNNAASSVLVPATHVWKVLRYDYKGRRTGQVRPNIHRGFAVNFGEFVYSSAYDRGEMPASEDIFPDQNGLVLSDTQAVFINPLAYTGGSLNAKLRFAIAGSATNNRVYRILLNNNLVHERLLNQFDARLDSVASLPGSLLAGSQVRVMVRNASTNLNDRIVAGFMELDYPRQPDAAGSTSFDFYLPASGESMIEIAQFNHGGSSPLLYDLSSQTVMSGLIMPGGAVRFLLPPSAGTRQFRLVANNPNGITSIGQLSQKNFINLANTANQANYLIITNPLLMGGSNNAVEEYRQYRSSAAGGGYNAKIYPIDELIDQFAFGIKMHPLSIKNFLRFARANFSATPQYCFLIGKGVTYDEMRTFENHPLASSLFLLPTFGYPASDILLATNDNTTATLNMPIGRLNAIRNSEVKEYLEKIKQFEAAQAQPSALQQDKAWMKNIVHVVGANDAGIESLIRPFMENYRRTIEDTLYGGRVTTFNKFNSTTASVIENELLEHLFANGFSLMTYFGHSSATALDYNLDDPQRYNNPGKYPVFLLNGCNAGNFYTFDTSRIGFINTISEKYILAPNRGAIGMIASTHFGIVNGLNVYSTGFYRSVSAQNYNRPLGINMRDAINYINSVWGVNDYIARLHTEQQTLHGDPAIRINAFTRPDYSIEQSNININPSFLSIAETNFKVKSYLYNIGRAINDSVLVVATRQYPQSSINPNGLTEEIYRKRIKAPLALDSLELTLPIFPERDKGINRISITIDADNRIDELSEQNNSAVREVVIFEDELRPVYPYNYAIVNKPVAKFAGSTSNPLGEPLTYRMQIDTTELFNSGLLVTRNVTVGGGLVEFEPGISFRDSTVYYWRLGIVRPTGEVLRWNTASFVYLNGGQTGFNQSHFYQHTKSTAQRLQIDSASRTWRFNTLLNNLFVNHSVFPVSGEEDGDFSVSVNGSQIIASACAGHSIIINVFDPIKFKPWRNFPGGLYGSALNNCVANNFSRQYNFEWDDRDTGNRRRIMQFLDDIPNGHYVLVRKFLDAPYDQETFAPQLLADQQFFGAGNTIYHRLKNAGFANIDSFNRPRIYLFLYKKNDASFAPQVRMSEGIFDRLQMNENCPTPDSTGFITSPLWGPAKEWKEARWRGAPSETVAGDLPTVDVVGVSAAGAETRLYTLNSGQQDFNLSAVNPVTYPFLRLRMQNSDTANGTPYQLRWWRIFYTPVPEGALAPSLSLQFKDSLTAGEPLNFRIAFKNISESAFDSLKLSAFVLDRNNVTHPIAIPRKKPLVAGDTLLVSFTVDTKDLPGVNTLYLAVNPDNDQPEQQFFNNFLYATFLVQEDKFKPLLDVTFDGQHILNRDIVSARPHIQIKLKDENNFLSLNDTSLVDLKLRFPSESNYRSYKWGTDTLLFNPPAGNDNTATIDFMPQLNEDSEGSEYELVVTGKDRVNNRAGDIEYRVSFQVFNKPMISNLMNYPNPFSTSTAFVFTLTGREIPQEFKIQIMTVTGKIVREITRQELGPLHVGTNITEYKWDGTDTYGQKLANGVYLYRVVTSLNGNRMDKFRLNDGFDQNTQDATDKFFNKGYGKMVILR
jgi:hypothetical protein